MPGTSITSMSHVQFSLYAARVRGRAVTEMLTRTVNCCRAAGILSVFILNILIVQITKKCFNVPRSRQVG
jgi:hypothetical protein